ncbi:hypothetical protein Verru16b_02160 [Lacunisphaera limnophila]|uniref:Alpha/beta hydrolase family protein n=1 Tax=Lacunisphaera limnophila TaxID=1838286 RepID=A0A1D8AW11_9BACT|nr:hypothetical protein [Lacunisphaera limnophila]AOS45084.1 hypothetical protein Verru16b_02160 [Lacunisphaera limnophila]
MNHRLLSLSGLLVLALGVLAGCQNPPGHADPLGLDSGPGYTPVNFRGDAQMPGDLHRVVVLPLHGGGLAAEETLEVLDGVLLNALQQQQRFEVIPLSRADCHRLYGAADFSSVAALPHGFLDQIATRYAVDAILFVDLTAFRPHQPLAVGFRAKLARAHDVRMVWAFDELFSAEDPNLRQSIRMRQRTAVQAPLVDPTPAVMQSPARFSAVAAELMFRTLPPR